MIHLLPWKEIIHLVSIKIGSDRGYGVTEGNALSERKPNKVNVISRVLSYSEPSNYKNIPIPTIWKSWGYNQSTSRNWQGRFQHLQQLMKLFSISALGEMGPIRTVPVKEWRVQEALLTRVLKLDAPEKCLVLHVRGWFTDCYCLDVIARCLRILHNTVANRYIYIYIYRGIYQYQQHVHLHCFAGDPEMVSKWSIPIKTLTLDLRD